MICQVLASSMKLLPTRHLPYRKCSLMIQKTEPTWANVNTDDPREMAEFNEREDRKAGERVKEAFQRLQSLGIVNDNGELVDDELPPNMRPGAKRDFGG
jgi:hypothetical protein